jgi:hypothetical protein
LQSATQSAGLNHSYSYDEENNLLTVSHSGTGTTGNGIPDWWKNYYLGTGVVNPLGNPTQDGVPNLMKYALGLNPNATNSGMLFNASYQTYTDGQIYPYLSYVRSKDAAMTLAFQMQQSSDLTTWQVESLSFQQMGVAIDLGNGTEQITLRSLTPVAGTPKLFFRLKITAP